MQSKEQAVRAIRESYNVLASASNLSPRNERITGSLTHLVRTLTTHSGSYEVTQYLLGTPDLEAERRQLPDLCGKAECEMEKYWAQHFLSKEKIDLREFWYFSEYAELTRAEINLFKDRHRFDHISFLGGGALPLTAFLLAQEFPDAKISCIDIDAEACALSQMLADRLGLKNVSVRCMNALDYTPQKDELVICASLLEGRKEVYRKLNDMPCALMVRDSEGVYQFLYKAAELPQAGFHEVAKTAVDARRINTSRFYERCKHAA